MKKINNFSAQMDKLIYEELLKTVQSYSKEHKKRPKREQAKLEANILITNTRISSSFKM